jgi:hypothetical protein
MIGAIVVGGTGDDSISSASDATITIAGGAGSDSIGSSGDVTGTVVAGGSKAAQLSVTGGTSVTLYGSPGDDTLAAVGGQSIYLFGEDGNNTYQLTGTANNPLSVFVNDLNTNSQTIATTDNTPNGVNTLQFPGVSGITIDLSNFSTGTMPTASQIQQVAPGLTVAMTGQFQNVVGTPGDDHITGNSGPNILDAGGSGNDTLIGGSGPATLIAGSGNDSLVAGTGGTTYRFPFGMSGSVIVDPPVDTAGLNALDFSQFGSAVTINLGLASGQTVSNGLSVTLSNPSAINGYVATTYNDSVTGNTADDRFFVGAGNDTFVGGGGNDTYFFNGGHLGGDTITETPSTKNALNFLAFDGPINLDLTQNSQQTLNPGNLSLTLTNPSAFTTAVGTPYNDTIKANSGNDTLIGAGGQDNLVAGSGNVDLQGDLTQVVLLQFLTSTLPGVHNYTADEQSTILSNLQQTYAAFNYFFTTDQPTAQQRAQATGGRYATLIFNQGPAGGAANDLDPGNIDLGSSATINVSPFLGDPTQGLVEPSSQKIINLSTTIAAHELGHLSGLQHQDAIGPIGTGIYSGIKPSAFNPLFPGPTNATETPLDIMASPDSVGTTLQQAAAQTQIGERDAIKLAFNDTGSLLKQSSLPTEPFNLVKGVSTAYVVNNLPGLTVPNTLMAGTRDSGKTFDVNAVAINGALATPTQEDFYAITAPAGQMTIQVISRNNTLNPKPIIPELEVLDANGNQVAYNEKEFESLDSTLLDLSLTAGGTYYVGVDSFLSLTAGNYQLFMYSFATGPVQNSGDTMVGGGGNDTMQGSSGNDSVTFLPGSAGSATVNAGSGQDTVDTTPAPAEKVTTTGNVTFIQPTTSTTATSLQPSANPSVYGQQVTFTATVTTSGSGTPTGSVTFYDGNTVLGTQPLSQIPGNDQAKFSTSTLSVATHSITATYNGDPNFTTSTSNAVSQVVSQDSTTTTLGSSANPSVYGQAVTFTATVAAVAPGAGTPTGTVNFYDNGTLLGSGTLDANDHAIYATSVLSVATHPITATYAGDTNFTTSTTSSTLSQVVNQASTTTTLSSSANPSVWGQSVTFTATVAAVAPGAGTPTGTVNFYDNGTLLGSGTLDANDHATYATSVLSVATHPITATYAGDTNFTTSTTSSALSQVVNQASTTTTLSSSANPSVWGQSVTFTATVAAVAPGAGTPTGTVNFYDNGTLLGSGTLDANDHATYATSALSVATHPITATYASDTNFTTSNSTNTVSQTVNKDGTSTTVASGTNPSVYGQSVTFTATVSASAPGSGTPTGTVNFYDNGMLLGSGTLGVVNGSDQATYATSSLSVATHPITATYAGDTNFTTSNSSNTVKQTVNQDGTSTSLTSSVNPSVYGQSVTFTATVSANSPGSGTPTGTVNFYDGNTQIGSGTLTVVNGKDQATYSTSTLGAGLHSITATYAGDTNFSTSTSSAVNQTVNQANTTTAGSASGSGYFGQAETFTATVTASSPSTATVVGTVDFFDTTTNNDLGTSTLDNTGKATLTTTMLPTGTQTIKMTYNGNANFVTSNTSVSVSIVTSIFVMNATATNALNATNDSIINIPGVVFVDSNSSTALNAADEVSITGGAIQVAGGFKKAKGATLNPPPTTGVAAVADPWAALVAPTSGTKKGSISISGSTTKTIDPGIYTSISVSDHAVLTLNPGIYAIAGGGLSISGNGSVKGSGVLIYNAGSNYPNPGGSFGSITLSTNAVLNISAATTGTYAGVAVFQSRDNTLAITVGGSSVINLQGGLLYAIKAQLTLSSSAAVRRAPTIVDTLRISGTAVIKNTDSNSAQSVSVPDVAAEQQAAFSLIPASASGANRQPPAHVPANFVMDTASPPTLGTNVSVVAVSSPTLLESSATKGRVTDENVMIEELGSLDVKRGPNLDGLRPTTRKGGVR